MSLQSNPYVVFVIVAGLVSATGAIFAYQRRKVQGAIGLTLMMIALTVWMFAYAAELTVKELPTLLLFVKLKYIGIVATPPLFLIFALQFAMPGRFERRSIGLLAIVPAVILLLVWTNDLHGLIMYNTAPYFNGTFYSFTYESGVGFWVWAVYAYVLLLSGSAVIVWQASRTYAEQRTQAVLLISAIVITWLGNIIYLTGNSFIPFLDITPFTLIISSVLLVWNLFRGGLLDLLPIAGENILQSLENAVLVLDHKNRIVFANQAFEFYTKLDTTNVIGAKIDNAISNWPSLINLVKSESTAHHEIELKLDSEYSLYFDVRFSNIKNNKGELAGRTFVLEEITERKQSERRLTAESDEENPERSADSIIPPVLVYRQSDGKIIEVNRSFVVTTGFNRNEVTGQSLLQLGMWTAEERANFIRELRDKDGKLHNYNLTLQKRDKEEIKLNMSAHSAEVGDERYVIILGQPVEEK